MIKTQKIFNRLHCFFSINSLNLKNRNSFIISYLKIKLIFATIFGHK